MILGWRAGNFFYMHGMVIDVKGLIAEPACLPARAQPVSGKTATKQIPQKSQPMRSPTGPFPRRAAASFNKSMEPTSVGAGRSAIAGHVIGPVNLNSVR